MKNFEVLKHDLENFEYLEDFQQESLADYIACPSVDNCKYDGWDNSICIKCKVEWLNDEWTD